MVRSVWLGSTVISIVLPCGGGVVAVRETREVTAVAVSDWSTLGRSFCPAFDDVNDSIPNEVKATAAVAPIPNRLNQPNPGHVSAAAMVCRLTRGMASGSGTLGCQAESNRRSLITSATMSWVTCLAFMPKQSVSALK